MTTNFAAALELHPAAHEQRLVEAVEHCKPGAVVSLSVALEETFKLVRLSASTVRQDTTFGVLVNGPYTGIRLAVRRHQFYTWFDQLRRGSLSDNERIAQILQIEGLVVGLGANRTNAAEKPDSLEFDPTGHGEIDAIRNGARAIGIPMGLYRKYDIVCLEAASCENCPMCLEANHMWAGTGLSIFANDLTDALHCTDEGYSVDVDEPDLFRWGVTEYEPPATRMTQVWAGGVDSELRERGRDAMRVFLQNGGTGYQPF